ncbi:hypothetical protein HPB48_019622 [Haemaphysalis longicornis]|uniref:Uncharacterized protein n=1 Tax=Haemaphysalis longicornis TaxID=44386 RepID=A0A9J6FR51_HAELO|nr:hypothetical protein HPB48_019622 [Haemaphysalis longicornis]
MNSPDVDFAKVLTSCAVCPLELLSRLHAGNVMRIEDYIALNVQNPRVIADLSRSLLTSCQLAVRSEPAALTFSVSACAVVNCAYSGSDLNDGGPSVRKVCRTVLETLLLRLLKACEEGQACGDLLGPLLKSPFARKSAIRSCAGDALACILAYNPVYKVTQAISSHHKWTSKNCSPWLLGTFQKVMQVLTVAEVTGQLQKTLNSKEVNWYMLLTALSVYVATYQDCTLLTGLIESLLKTAFECLGMEHLVSAFLLARQAAQEAPLTFPPYSSWFEKYFGFSDTTYANSSNTFAFLVKVLSDMVPFERSRYLRAHIQKPAHAPPKCRPLYHDYVILAKTRLQDLEEADDKPASEDQEQFAQAYGFVRECLEDFAAKGKIPRSVIEASIFKKPYFSGQFLPVLLNRSNFPEQQDVVCSLVQGLFQHGKISKERYEKFLSDGEKRQREGGDQDVEMSSAPSLLEHLIAHMRCEPLTEEDCAAVVTDLSQEIQKRETEELQRTLELGVESADCKDVFELLYFVGKACCQQPQKPWVTTFQLSMTRSLCTVRVLGKFLWELLTGKQMDKEEAEVFSRFLLCMPVMWEDRPVQVSFQGTTYSSVHEAMFSSFPLATHQDRRRFLQLSATYLTLAAQQTKATALLPSCVPEVLIKKFKFVAHRAGHLRKELDPVTWTRFKESPAKQWLESHDLSVQEWVDLESRICDDTASAILRQDLLSFISSGRSARHLCAALLQALVSGGPRTPNYSQLQILLQSLLLNPARDESGESVPFATQALVQMEDHVPYCGLNGEEKAARFFRLYVHLPPYCLLVNRPEDCPTSESVQLFITVVNKHLLQCSPEATPSVTLHLFRGLLQSNLSRAHASSILEQCPVLAYRLALHWKTIAPILDQETVKCDELGNLMAGVRKLYALAEEFVAGSVDSGRKLSKISKTWLPALVLACSISADGRMPSHYDALTASVQQKTLQFLTVLCQRKAWGSDLKACISKFILDNPSLCSALALFDAALMNTLMPALDFFELLVSSFNLIVDVVCRQDSKCGCCLSTAISLMARLETIDGDFQSWDAAAEGAPSSASARLYALVRKAPAAVLRSLPETTVANCPEGLRQCIEQFRGC